MSVIESLYGLCMVHCLRERAIPTEAIGHRAVRNLMRKRQLMTKELQVRGELFGACHIFDFDIVLATYATFSEALRDSSLITPRHSL